MTTSPAVSVVAGILLVSLAAPATAQTARLAGEALYRERIALPPDAVFEAVLEDVSRADARAIELGRARMAPATNPPIRFEIVYDPGRIVASGRYQVRAAIRAGERLVFATTEAYPVLTGGAPRRVELLLRMQAGGAAPAADLGSLPATFRGELPCADCPGVHYHLNLYPGGLFALRLEYRDRPGVFDDLGRWSLDEATLTLVGQRGEPERYRLMGRLLNKLDGEGRPIESALNYDLERAPAFERFEARVAMRGTYRYMADSGSFAECRSGARLPVAHERENALLERAYAEARSAPGTDVLVEVEGRLVARPPMEGEGLREAIVVDRFVRAQPGETCAGETRAEGVSGVEGVRWRLVELEGQPVAPPENRPAPHLEIADGRAAGSDGCNRFMGPAKVDGDTIALGPLATTMMACLDDAGAEGMGKALAAARTWRRAGDRLELLDEAGTTRAAFVAE